MTDKDLRAIAAPADIDADYWSRFVDRFLAELSASGYAVVRKEWLRSLEPHLDAVICYASDMNEHPPNRAVKEIRDLLATTKEEQS